ncbi:MAG TPA: hypothetical protein VFK21_11395 [Gammaproteobacteria bacterium]|nr:hypothetical protein [Gammaproteobacteria bacterium]
MVSRKSAEIPDSLPNYVRDIATATCVFCPYGADVQSGDRLYVYDEKTVFDRQQRERLVEITAVKLFRSTGRVITLDLNMISAEEAQRIADDSEMSLESLLEHRAGNSTFDDKRPPVVVYFSPCEGDDTTDSRTRPKSALSIDSDPSTRKRGSSFGRILSRLKPK